MAIIVPFQAQSSAAINGQSTTFLADQIILQCAGAPDTLINTQLQNTIRDFYTRSTGWREIIGPFQVTQGIDTVQLNPVDQYSQVLFVIEAWLYPFPTTGNQKQWLRPSTRKIIGTDVGQPTTIWGETPTLLHYYPVPDRTYGQIAYFYCCMRPVINTTQLPTISTEEHFDALVSGTLARLFAIPKRPWSDMNAAKEHDRVYRRSLVMWRDYAERGYGPADKPVQFPLFAGRGSQRTTRGF